MSKGLYRHKETWWWNEEVAEVVREKKKKYGNWKKKQKLTEAWKEYKKSKQNTKRVIYWMPEVHDMRLQAALPLQDHLFNTEFLQCFQTGCCSMLHFLSLSVSQRSL